eukprot:gb/GECH01012972.1/.p1 GENE.gb/GECH01012972.1/~~gb/GECH01012972.1/.p1  ORF type:complete len:670 (+),score=136.54 gb/GECH01012972.1/:1-2010(+)
MISPTQQKTTILSVFTVVFVVVGIVFLPSTTRASRPLSTQHRDIIQHLYHKIEQEQWQESHTFRPFPPRWSTQRGLFRSFIHINFVGGEAEDILRNDFRIPDMNMFVTSFVLTALAEAEQLGAVQPDPDLMAQGINAMATFHDSNRDADTNAYCFWPQAAKQHNGKTLYTARPVNLVEPMKYFDSFSSFVEHVLKFLGLGHLEHKVESIANVLDSMADAFHIPADADDTSVNLVLGAVLKQTADRSKRGDMYRHLLDVWHSHTPNPTSAFPLLSQYAYRPLVPYHKGPSVNRTNVVDPRTYYFLSDYIASLNSSASKPSSSNPFFSDENVRIVSTWMEHIVEDEEMAPVVAMPFQVNNVDLTVCVNTLYGISHTFLSRDDRKQWFNTEVQSILENTAKAVAWGIRTDSIFSRPDLGLLYYPSIYDFYWLVSRVLFLLDNEDFDHKQYPVFHRVREVLDEALRTHGTQQLLESVASQGNQMFWDDFLGDYGGKKRGEDRLFSTALGINALIDIWTQRQGHNGRAWLSNTPSAVQDTVDAAVHFMKENVLRDKYPPQNAFFSGSVKAPTSMPFAYPGNYAADLRYSTKPTLNPLKDNLPSKDLDLVSFGLSGTVSQSHYKEMVQKVWWQVFHVPTKFGGYNKKDAPFPFWSSPVMTWSTSLLAFAKYDVLQ